MSFVIVRPGKALSIETRDRLAAVLTSSLVGMRHIPADKITVFFAEPQANPTVDVHLLAAYSATGEQLSRAIRQFVREDFGDSVAVSLMTYPPDHTATGGVLLAKASV